MDEFTSGAKRAEKGKNYLLVPHPVILALIEVLEHGAKVYGLNNWQKGELDQTFRESNLNHALDHIYNYVLTGGREHLLHAFCDIMFEVYFAEKTGKTWDLKEMEK